MTDRSTGDWFQEPSAGQPSDVSQQAATTAATPSGAPVNGGRAAEQAPANQEITIRDLMAAVQQLKEAIPSTVQQSITELERRQQSDRDRERARLQEEFKKLRELATFINGGNAPTAEQEQALQKIAEQNVKTAPAAQNSSPTSPATAGQPGASGAGKTEQPTPTDWKVTMAQQALNEAGVQLQPGSQEAAELRAALKSDSPSAILAATQKVIEKVRQAKAQGARIGTPSAGGGTIPGDYNPIADVYDTNQLWQLARNRK